MNDQIDFSDIAPYGDDEFNAQIRQLVKEPGFEHALRYVMPDVDYPAFAAQLSQVKDNHTFTYMVMKPFIDMLVMKTTRGVTVGGLDNISPQKAYTHITNHRDIVLDASFLNYCFLTNGYPTAEVAIGDNLLIYDWITNLVKLNKSFIVKRNLRLTKALEAAKQLSAYIHYAISTKHASVWIAQREGRAKDSNDKTQESVVKMLALGGTGTLVESIMEINIAPVAISYEYDPNDYLKAREFLLRRLDPEFKKSQRDDLFSMETGLLSNKGRVHFEVAPCINPQIEHLKDSTDKVEAVKTICSVIDNAIHSRYKIFEINYVAYDLLHGSDRYSSMYTPEQKAAFEQYLADQLKKVDIPDVSQLDYDFMMEMMLKMYANPLLNKLSVGE